MPLPDLRDPGLCEAGVPHATFAALRRDDPVHWQDDHERGFWSVTRFADIAAVSRQPQLFSSANEWGGHRFFDEQQAGLLGAGDSGLGIPFISRDPPTQTTYRKLTMPALAPGRLGDIEARIRERVTALVAAIPADEPVDIVEALNAPLPLLTLAELIGVDLDTWPTLYRWTNAFIGEDDPDFRRSPEELNATLAEFFALPPTDAPAGGRVYRRRRARRVGKSVLLA